MINIDYLIHMRQEKGYNKSELAQKIGSSAALITFFEKGQRQPSIENIIKICNALDADSNMLLGIKYKSWKLIDTK